MSVEAPERPQHLRALDEANRVRFAHAAVLRHLRSLDGRKGAEWIAGALRSEQLDDDLGAMRVGRLIAGITRFGPVRVRKLLARVGMPAGRQSRRVRDLTEREREALAADLLIAVRPGPPLTLQQREVVRVLDGEWRTARALGLALGRSAQSVSTTLGALEGRGLAERKTDGPRQPRYWRTPA